MIDDRRPHVMPEDEADRHVFNMTCTCKPKLVRDGVVVHFGFTVKRRQWKVSQVTYKPEGEDK